MCFPDVDLSEDILPVECMDASFWENLDLLEGDMEGLDAIGLTGSPAPSFLKPEEQGPLAGQTVNSDFLPFTLQAQAFSVAALPVPPSAASLSAAAPSPAPAKRAKRKAASVEVEDEEDFDLDGIEEKRRQKRLVKNRLTAAASRQRKKVELGCLKDRLDALAAENASLRSLLALKDAQLARLALSLPALAARSASNPSVGNDTAAPFVYRGTV